MNIKYFISDRQVEKECVIFIPPTSAFYDKNCKGLLYEDSMLIKLHKLDLNYNAFMPSLDFDSFVERLNNIMTHEIFHNECRKENFKYTYGEEVVIYRVTEDLSDEDIKIRLVKKMMYSREKNNSKNFIRRLRGWFHGNISLTR